MIPLDTNITSENIPHIQVLISFFLDKNKIEKNIKQILHLESPILSSEYSIN